MLASGSWHKQGQRVVKHFVLSVLCCQLLFNVELIHAPPTLALSCLECHHAVLVVPKHAASFCNQLRRCGFGVKQLVKRPLILFVGSPQQLWGQTV